LKAPAGKPAGASSVGPAAAAGAGWRAHPDRLLNAARSSQVVGLRPWRARFRTTARAGWCIGRRPEAGAARSVPGSARSAGGDSDSSRGIRRPSRAAPPRVGRTSRSPGGSNECGRASLDGAAQDPSPGPPSLAARIRTCRVALKLFNVHSVTTAHEQCPDVQTHMLRCSHIGTIVCRQNGCRVGGCSELLFASCLCSLALSVLGAMVAGHSRARR